MSGVLGVLLSLIIIVTLAVAMVFIMRFRKRQRNTGILYRKNKLCCVYQRGVHNNPRLATVDVLFHVLL